MSMTDLKALGLSWLMEARKLPAAPALRIHQFYALCRPQSGCSVIWTMENIHYKINTSQLTNTPIHSRLQALNAPYVYRSKTQNLGTLPSCSEVLGHALRLFIVAAYYTGVCTKIDQCPDLSTAYGACAARAEDDFVVYPLSSVSCARRRVLSLGCTKYAVFPHLANVFVLG